MQLLYDWLPGFDVYLSHPPFIAREECPIRLWLRAPNPPNRCCCRFTIHRPHLPRRSFSREDDSNSCVATSKRSACISLSVTSGNNMFHLGQWTQSEIPTLNSPESSNSKVLHSSFLSFLHFCVHVFCISGCITLCICFTFNRTSTWASSTKQVQFITMSSRHRLALSASTIEVSVAFSQASTANE